MCAIGKLEENKDTVIDYVTEGSVRIEFGVNKTCVVEKFHRSLKSQENFSDMEFISLKEGNTAKKLIPVENVINKKEIVDENEEKNGKNDAKDKKNGKAKKFCDQSKNCAIC